jgi:hypothetical protein
MSAIIKKYEGWYAERFNYGKKKIHKNCKECKKDLWFPKSKAEGRYFCDQKCKKNFDQQQIKLRESTCLHCAGKFIPRNYQIKTGGGKFCSHSCSLRFNLQLFTPQAKVKRLQKFLQNIAEGLYVPPKGADHPCWTGGFEASQERNKNNGKKAQWVRNYRKNNKAKVLEFAHTRKSRKFGRLPKGTVQKLGESQKWKCVVCNVSIKGKYHLDHIQPLAKEGKHIPTNVQLLCPQCNVRKSAKDPIDFMQSRGFLL